LHNLCRAIEDRQDALWPLVYEAREQQERLTWSEIADALGITRQAAWERFTLYRRSAGHEPIPGQDELPL
jgi:predicted transcriptional regulator